MLLPLKESIKAKPHTSQYKVHKYFARRPWNVFNNLIQYYSKENDIVLDVFCGGGVTIFESLSLKRNVIGVDINPLSTFITEMQLQKEDLNELRASLYKWLEEIKSKYNHFYEQDNKYIIWTEYCYRVKCPECKNLIKLLEKNKLKNGIYKCPNTNCKYAIKGIKRVSCEPFDYVPIKIKFEGEEKIIELDIDKNYLINYNINDYLLSDYLDPDEEIPSNWDRYHEDKLFNKGIYTFKDLFTNRNYLINLILYNEIMKLSEDKFKNILYYIFSSSLRYSNNMTRVTSNWENGKPTSMDKHAYWLPNQFIENNIFIKIENRIEAILKAINYTNIRIAHNIKKVETFSEIKQNNYMLLNQSSSSLPIPDSSIDVIITDPPYGSNVQYAELSAFWNIWLKQFKNLDSFMNNKLEAVMNRKKNFEASKDITHYEDMLTQIFKECFRVLKDESYLVFTFNNKDFKVWYVLLRSIAKAGFYLPHNGIIFQDFIESYKNTSHLKDAGNIHGDFIYSFKKGLHKINKIHIQEDINDFLERHIIKTIIKLYDNNFSISFTTTVVYQTIFEEIVHILYDFIINELNDEKILEVEKFSTNYLEVLLKKYLYYKNDKWYLKCV